MSADEVLQEAARLVRTCERVVWLTGAGLSVASGLAPYRKSKDAVWSRFITDWGTLERFQESPADWWREFWLKAHADLAGGREVRPNAGHDAITGMVRHHPEHLVVTQNIDGLHQEAGSAEVRQIHGSVFEVVSREGRWVRIVNRSTLRRVVKRLAQVAQGDGEGKWGALGLGWAMAPLVGWRGQDRLRVVMWGEALREPDWQLALEEAQEADVLLVIGTSGMVQPAASLPELVRARGGRVIGVDPEAVGYEVDVWLKASADHAMARLMMELGIDWRAEDADGGR